MDAVPGIPIFRSGPNARSRPAPSRPAPSPIPYVGRLGSAEVGCGRQEAAYPSCPLAMFARAGLPSAERVVVSERAHCEFMDHSGLGEQLRSLRSGALGNGEEAPNSATLQAMRLRYLSSPIEGELNRQICEALIGLGAPRVAVVSEDLIRRDLKSIPEVKGAIREAWLSLEGLGRQMEAAFRGEVMPTWPVFILGESAPH